jgi:hypothetical protein
MPLAAIRIRTSPGPGFGREMGVWQNGPRAVCKIAARMPEAG